MKKKYIKFLAGFIVLLILSNINPFKFCLSLFLDDDHFRYSNYSGSYTTKEHILKGNGYKGVQASFGHFKADTLLKLRQVDTVLYRLFWKNPFRFWLLKDYFTDPRYDLPYESWRKIKRRRGYEIKGYRTNYQKF